MPTTRLHPPKTSLPPHQRRNSMPDAWAGLQRSAGRRPKDYAFPLSPVSTSPTGTADRPAQARITEGFGGPTELLHEVCVRRGQCLVSAKSLPLSNQGSPPPGKQNARTSFFFFHGCSNTGGAQMTTARVFVRKPCGTGRTTSEVRSASDEKINSL